MNNFCKGVVVVLLFMVGFVPAEAQNSRVPMDDIMNAIKANKVQDMEKYIDNFVTISINNTQSICSPNQAEVILHDFFQKNDAKDFSVMDSGNTNASSFVIGSYSPSPGSKYTVYVLLKVKENKSMLQEIRITKE